MSVGGNVQTSPDPNSSGAAAPWLSALSGALGAGATVYAASQARSTAAGAVKAVTHSATTYIILAIAGIGALGLGFLLLRKK